VTSRGDSLEESKFESVFNELVGAGEADYDDDGRITPGIANESDGAMAVDGASREHLAADVMLAVFEELPNVTTGRTSRVHDNVTLGFGPASIVVELDTHFINADIHGNVFELCFIGSRRVCDAHEQTDMVV
jgi:hypothetical protein